MSADLPVKPCPDCGARIIWPRSAANGTPMPLDANPSDRGNVMLHKGSSGTLAAVVTPRAAAGARAAGQDTYLSHGATCPFADRWRRRTTGRPG